jgi:hypothetical protein
VAELRVRQQHAGEEGAEAGRQADLDHQQRCPDHHHQRGGGEDLVAPVPRRDAEHRPQQPASAGDQGQHCSDLDEVVGGWMRGDGGGRRQHRDQRQQRDDRDVLQQQDGEGGAAMPGGELLAFREQLQHEGRRGQRQDQADDQRRLPRQAECHRGAREQRAGDQNLGGAGAEDALAQGPQARRLQLQADDEQQQHHAELGEMKDPVDIGEQLEAPGADDDAGREIAEHRTEAQAARDRHRDHGGDEVGEQFGE